MDFVSYFYIMIFMSGTTVFQEIDTEFFSLEISAGHNVLNLRNWEEQTFFSLVSSHLWQTYRKEVIFVLKKGFFPCFCTLSENREYGAWQF